MRMNMFLKVIFMIALAGFSLLSFSEPVWIDVRTADEHQQDHIKGDPLIPSDVVVSEITRLYPDKKTPLNLYCRSGGRAGKAKTALEAVGYTHVNNAGGIADARKQRKMKAE